MLSTKCIQNKANTLFRVKGVLFLGLSFAGALVLGHFYFDKILKFYLETQLSHAYGVSVNIDSIKTQLLKQHVEFHRVQFSNPEIPMKNLIELDTVDFDFGFSELVRKKLIIPKMKIMGVHYDTVRDESGKVSGSEGVFSGVASSTDSATYNIHSVVRKQMDQDPLKYLAPISLGFRAPGKTEKIKTKLATLLHIDDAKAQVDEITASWKHFSETISKLDKTGSNKKILAENIRSLETQIRKAQLESQNIKNNLENMDEALKIDTASMRTKLDLPQFERWDLTATLFGPIALRSVERLNYWSTLARQKIPAPSKTASVQVVASPRNAGLSFHFGTPKSKPSFIVQNISIESQSDPLRPTKGDVKGVIKHLTLDSGLLGLPIEIHLHADFPNKNLRNVQLEAAINHIPGKLSEAFTLRIGEMPLNKWILYRNSDFKLTLAPTKATLSSEGSLNGPNLKLEWKLGISEPNISISSRYIQVEDLLKDLLRGIGPFEVKTNISGPLSQLNYHPESKIGAQIAEGIQKAYERTLNGVDDDLKNSLIEQTALPRRAVIESLSEAETKYLSEWQNLREKLEALRTEADRNSDVHSSGKHTQSKSISN